MRRGGFVQAQGVLAVSGLIVAGVLGWRLEGGWPIFVTSIALGLVFAGGLLLAHRRLHLELATLCAVLFAAFVLGGARLLHPAYLSPWATVFVLLGPPAVLSVVWAFFNRRDAFPTE